MDSRLTQSSFFSLVSLELCKQKKPRKYRGFKGFVSKKPRRNAGLIALKILPCELLAFCKHPLSCITQEFIKNHPRRGVCSIPL